MKALAGNYRGKNLAQMSFGNASIGRTYNYLPVNPFKPYETGTYLQAIQQDLMTLIFISRIPKEIDDTDMTDLLNTCGKVKSWKRVKNVDGSLTHFGFCIFDSALGVIRAIRSIAPERPAGYEWTKDDPKYPFIVKADISTKNYIRSHPEMKTFERDGPVLAKLKDLFGPLKMDYRGEMSLVAGEKKSHEKEEVDSKETNEVIEQEKAARKAQEKLSVLKEREKRLEHQEITRIRRFYADLQIDNDKERDRLETVEFQRKVYAEYDDNLEADLEKDLFFKDRDRWWAGRKAKRSREIEMDLRDRREEEKEKQAAMSRELELMEKEREREKEKEKEVQFEESVTNSVNEVPEMNDSINVTRIMTQEERKNAIRELVKLIPADKEGIFSWPIKWDCVDLAIMGNVEKTVKKKVEEYLGDESKDLVSFILQKLQTRIGAQGLYDELIPLLVEDTEIFVLKVWRFLIYETESRSKGLS